ncbi:hypothetical protein [Bifidobacterium callitrichidarum]|uniref:Sugar ABC transporter substrate-binding protein n=1 Tax=Bifidobacterium callitrichidarum TaxID=2052941 RepID=A0A2U2N3H2_9BIFI|nr:hypothetical protein [Bifidobacterium callitrichidarum]PWG63785.1 hypothetical protein DF196_10080 [Bifidobacterium callitrichidarum]
MKPRIPTLIAAVAAAAAVLSLTACAPAGRAVGDTQDSMPAVAHDSVHITDATVGFVGSEDPAADKLAINAISDSGMNVFYASLAGQTSPKSDTTGKSTDDAANTTGGTAAESDSEPSVTVDSAAVTAQQAVDDFVARAVKLVVISGINVTDANSQGWDEALTNARNAGIPVALLNPVALPENDLLYAATLAVNDRDAEATPISDVALTIIRDEPHDRTIAVTTNTGN